MSNQVVVQSEFTPTCFLVDESESSELPTIEIHTDGSCLRNPGGPGAWAAVIIQGDKETEISGRENAPTTNNRMEIMAAIKALEYLSEPSQVTLLSDSTYLVNGATGWSKGWKHRGWMRREHRKLVPVPNADLWQRIVQLCERHRVKWKHERGHDKNKHNNRCDYLANCALRPVIYKPFRDSETHPTPAPSAGRERE